MKNKTKNGTPWNVVTYVHIADLILVLIKDSHGSRKSKITNLGKKPPLYLIAAEYICG